MRLQSERDNDILSAVVDYCERIEATYQRIGRSYECFREDPDFRDAFLMNILQIGEAATRLSGECREELSDLPWSNIIGTRNVIVHGYVKVQNDVIWHIIEKDIPELKKHIKDSVGL